MSILIKGIEMPQNCLTCACTDSEYGECVLDQEKRCPEDYGKRAEWCPLIEIPEPHGRLIDADALCDGLVSNHPVVIHAKNAPIIIPASEGGET